MKAIVDSLLVGVIYPIIAAIFGKPDFHHIGFDIGEARISIGLVIAAIINFVVVGLILFLLVKGWNRLRRTPATRGRRHRAVGPAGDPRRAQDPRPQLSRGPAVRRPVEGRAAPSRVGSRRIRSW